MVHGLGDDEVEFHRLKESGYTTNALCEHDANLTNLYFFKNNNIFLKGEFL
jgi:hypothetical protein